MLRALLILFYMICGIGQVHARWSTIEDAPIEYISSDQHITINANGSSHAIVETKQKVLKESGRSHAAHFMLYYTAPNMKLRVIEAKTIVNGREYNVSENMIEDQPLASAPHGFDQRHQVLISFPSIEVGAIIYIKYEVTDYEPILDGFYSTRLYYGSSGYWQKATTKIKSELPLYWEINDPKEVLKIKADKQHKNILITLAEPVCNELVSGSEVGVLKERNLTWVAFSSMNNWQDFARMFSSNYEKIASQKLPNNFANIVARANTVKDEVGKINIVTSMLNERVQYMGDWRSVAGRFFPRDLMAINSSQIGDCKDFAVSTAAILNHLGFKANVSLVMRGIEDRSFVSKLPNIADFNHAFVKAIGKNNKIYWIDPTNEVSMAQGIFGDVADRMVLVLNPGMPQYERSASVDPANTGVAINIEMTINGAIIENKGQFTLIGERAASLTGASLYTSKQVIKDFLFKIISNTYLEEEDKKAMVLPDLGSRVVRDLTFSFDYTQSDRALITNLGMGIPLLDTWTESVINGAAGQHSDLALGLPRTLRTKHTIRDRKIVDVERLNYEKDTKWLNFKRTYTYTENGTEIDDVVVFKKSFIANDDLHSADYKDLKRCIINNLNKVVLVLPMPQDVQNNSDLS